MEYKLIKNLSSKGTNCLPDTDCFSDYGNTASGALLPIADMANSGISLSVIK